MADEATAVNEETTAHVIASLRDMDPFLDLRRLIALMKYVRTGPHYCYEID
jgi:hypothetical protein